MVKLNTRREKIIYGSFWTTKRSYSTDGKLVGTIIKNPHTKKYEVVASDFKNYKYINTEFNTLKEALQLIHDYYEQITNKR